MQQQSLLVEADERGPQRLRRKALESADAVAATFEGILRGDAHAIHDARRRLKELRALTSILSVGKHERRFFRDAGRMLSAARDAKAALEGFDRLRERFASEWKPRQYEQIRRALKTRTDVAVDPGTLKALRSALMIERGRIAAWPVDQMHREELWRALTKSYRRARRAMRRALRDRTAEAIHDWRKRVKTHWYHARFLIDVAAMPADEREEPLRKLSRHLGHYHDLVIIDELSSRSPELLGSARYVSEFRTFVARAQSELLAQAEAAGGKLFRKPAREWIASVREREPRLRIGPKKAPKPLRARAAMRA